MGLRKYDKEAENLKKESELKAKEEETNKLNTIIEENSKEEEELKNLPADEKQKAVEETIEKARTDYANYAKKQKRLNTIASVCVLIVLVGALILMMTLSKTVKWISYVSIGIMIAALIVTFSLTKVIKKKMSAKAEEYIDVLYKQIDSYLYIKDDFKDAEFKPQSQMKDELFIDAGFYKNIKGTKSRNLVSVMYKDKLLGISDLAGNILIKNRLSPMFLGKYYDYSSKYDKDDKRILMQIKGGELSRPIDNIDDLKLVEGNDRYVIYTNDDEWRKTLTSSVIKDITALKVDKTLIDVIISIRKGKLNIGIDYVDEFMNIPVESKFDVNKLNREELDLNKVLKVLDDLN